MCGRFTLTTPTDELAEYFRVLESGLPSARGRLRPRYNVAPTQPVTCVRRRREGSELDPAAARRDDAGGAPSRELVEMRWGLIPFWAKDPAIGSRLINARSESVADKPAYREAFRRRRCLVLADGFYEWKKVEGGKQPYFIHLSGRRPFAFAGLWERWKPRGDQLDKLVAPDKPDVPVSDDGRVESCAFLTTIPNERLAEIHDRMPVILPEEHWETWLDPEFDDADALSALLLPYPAAEMAAYPVSKHVNKPANDDPACQEPLKTVRILRPDAGESSETPAEPSQESLF